MQIQLGKGRGLRCTEAALRSMALHTATARAAWRQKSVAKMVVGEAWKEIGVAGGGGRGGSGRARRDFSVGGGGSCKHPSTSAPTRPALPPPPPSLHPSS